jgi:hypothetical protein
VLLPALSLSPPSNDTPGLPVVLHAEGSAADRCVDGTLLFRFFVDSDASGGFSAGDAVLRPFGTSPTLLEAPYVTTRYGVTVKCSTGGTGACAGADAVATFTSNCVPPPAVYDASLWWTQVRWSSKSVLKLPPFGEITDLVRGDLGLLRGTGSFAASAAACLGNDQTGWSIAEPAVPAQGSGYYYLLRGQVRCNEVTSYRTFSARENPGNPGQRDAEITVCPP